MLPAAANPVSGSLFPKGQTSLTLDQWLGATSTGTDREKGSPPKRHEGGAAGGGEGGRREGGGGGASGGGGGGGGGGGDCIIWLPKMILHIIDTISVENASWMRQYERFQSNEEHLTHNFSCVWSTIESVNGF